MFGNEDHTNEVVLLTPITDNSSIMRALKVCLVFWYFYLFATQLHYLKMPKENKKKNVGRDGEEA